jgi:hypothetical protein
VSAAIVTVAVDGTTQRVLLVVAAVLVGASVGLVGALILGAVTGARATPPRTRAVPVRAHAPALTDPLPEPVADPVAPAPSPFVTPGIGSVPALYMIDSDVVRDRHRDLYDAEYVKQLDHVDALRRTIGTRLALAGDLDKPSEESDSSEELDA